MVDSIITCEIPEEDIEDDEKNMLRDYVLEVQQHKHTTTCEKKKKGECRFDFPKLVSEKTILAIPIEKRYPGSELSEELKKKKLEMYKKILSKTKEVLSNKNLDSNP